MKGKHWLTTKEAEQKYGVKSHTLRLLGKNGSIRTKMSLREEGQMGRTPVLYNNRDLSIYSAFPKKVQKEIRARKNSKPLGVDKEETKKSWNKMSREEKIRAYRKRLEIPDDVYKQTYYTDFNKNAEKTWDSIKDSMKKVWENSVNQPKHYNPGTIPVIDAIDDWGLDFSEGNIVKYVVRAGNKKGEGRKSDLLKALWYIERLLKDE